MRLSNYAVNTRPLPPPALAATLSSQLITRALSQHFSGWQTLTGHWARVGGTFLTSIITRGNPTKDFDIYLFKMKVC